MCCVVDNKAMFHGKLNLKLNQGVRKMSTVRSMFKNNKALEDIREGGYGPADFDIDTAELVYTPAKVSGWLCDLSGPQTSSKVVVYRTDTGAELGVHGRGYKAVPPKHMIDVTRNILERSDLRLDNMRERIDTSHDGARTFVHYTLPEHTYETGDGDTAALSLLSLTSTDGTWPFMISAAADQWACTNKQVFVTGAVSIYKAKHTPSLDIEHGGRVITKSLAVFEQERELWRAWQQRHFSGQQAFEFFAKTLKATTAVELSVEGHQPEDIILALPRKNASLEYMWDKYTSLYRKRLGSNFWAVYNAMTDWSTHAETARKSTMTNIASVKNQRHEAVRAAIVSSPLRHAA